MGKLITDSLNDELNVDVEEDEVMERLNQYSILFDKSLLKLFGKLVKKVSSVKHSVLQDLSKPIKHY